MNELLKLSDAELMQHERVRKAYWVLIHDRKEWDCYGPVHSLPSKTEGVCCRCGKSRPMKYGHTFKDVGVNACVPDPIPVSIYQAAFEMRDACMSSLFWCKRLIDIETITQMRGGIDGQANNAHVIRWSRPNHWIIAAVMCYEQKGE